MTRKDYRLIADTVSRLRLSGYLTAAEKVSQRKAIAEDFADALRGTSPRFDRERFLEACR